MTTTVGCTPSRVAPPKLTRAETVEILSRAWQSADAELAGDLAASSAVATREQLAAAAQNIGLLGLKDVSVSLREGSSPSLRITWRIPQFESRLNSTTLSVVWADSASGPKIVGLRTQGRPIPLWLLEPVSIRRAAKLMVYGGAVTDLDALLQVAELARKGVMGALPEWNGMLIVEAPSSQGLLESSLAVPRGSYSGVAAVASSSDGSAGSDVAQRILINPRAYRAMKTSAARLVMTHEVVHVATRAATVPVPLWWAEGFAEYVAFESVDDADDLPDKLLAQAGERLVAALARTGSPGDLPTTEDFNGDRQEIAYEASRRACVVLATLAKTRSRGGSIPALAAFQEQLSGGASVAAALTATFGISYAAFLERWQAELERTRPPIR